MVVKQIDAGTLGGTLLAVADGHGGDQTSSYVASQLSEGLFDRILAEKKSPKGALDKTFQYLNDATHDLSRTSGAHYESGTTLSIVYVPDGQQKCHVGIIGDSPVILARKDGSVHVAPEHNARSNAEERKAAEQRGGRFIDGYLYGPDSGMGLQMTRDIGYHAMGDIVGRRPDICDFAISKGDIIIVGSDGLLDPVHNDTVIEARRLAKLVLGGAEAQELVADALRRETGDNVTAIVYSL